MKTPEELASEYGATPHEKDAFTAGYQAAQPRWISVKERLPKKPYGWTMVYGCLLSRWMVQPGFYDHEESEWVSRFISSENEGYVSFEAVTHWMMAPEPPKEEK